MIYGDDFTALKHGPVPQETYNLIKKYRDNNAQYPVAICGNNIKALRDANLDVFSESDIECLDEATSEYDGHLSFGKIKNKSRTIIFIKLRNYNDFYFFNFIQFFIGSNKFFAFRIYSTRYL